MLTIKADTKKAVIFIDDLRGKIDDLRPVFHNFQAYMLRRTALTFRELRQGGTFRGVRWAWFADQYTRKDGTVVPAEGGIAKVRGKGVVKGRLRGEGKTDAHRVKRSSSLVADTSRLRNAALTRQRITKNRLTMDTPVKYAARQHALRPFSFFEDPKDVNILNGFIQSRIEATRA